MGKREPWPERFWRQVDKGPHPRGCWLWTGSTVGGYGMVKRPGSRRNERAHRVSFELACGAPPVGELRHGCDITCCVRPSHLKEGTHGDNMRDMAARGRHAFQKDLASGAVRAEKMRAARLRFDKKLDVGRARAIFALRGKEPQRATAARFGVSQTTVSEIQRGAKRTRATGGV